jgi:hypothetical protein
MQITFWTLGKLPQEQNVNVMAFPTPGINPAKYRAVHSFLWCSSHPHEKLRQDRRTHNGRQENGIHRRYQQPLKSLAQSHAYVYPHLMKSAPSCIGHLCLEVTVKKLENSLLRWWAWQRAKVIHGVAHE